MAITTHRPDRAAAAPAAAGSGPAAPPAGGLPPGVVLRPLDAQRDERGVVAEFFVNDWQHEFSPAQWTMTVSEAEVLRGVHVHQRHADWLVVLDGAAWVGLRDLRAGAPANGRACCFEMRDDAPAALHIPPGVAHGFLFLRRTVYALGLSQRYDPTDELGCHWRDPDLGIAWPAAAPRLSARDAALPPLRELALRMPLWTRD